MSATAMLAGVDDDEPVKKKPKPLSWKPRLRGRTYCSPACGSKCLHSEYLKAVEKSDKLAKRLGLGWKANVWENGGWHWEVSNGKVTLKPPHYGRKEWSATWANQFWVHGTTIARVLKELKQHLSDEARDHRKEAQEQDAAIENIDFIFQKDFL